MEKNLRLSVITQYELKVWLLLQNVSKKGLNVLKKMARNVLKNPRRDLDVTANIATAAESRNP